MVHAKAQPDAVATDTDRKVAENARPAIFLDRDGTIIEEKCYLSDPGLVELLPGAAEGLRRMRELGFALVVVTNQSGIGRGYYGWEELGRVHARMEELLGAEGVTLDRIYVCPHAPTDDCACRKPLPGMIEQACGELGLSAAASFMVGDKACDIALGQAVGATSILVTTGYGAEELASKACLPDAVAADLAEAAHIIARRIADRADVS